MTSLSELQKAFFHKNGYLILPGAVIGHETLEAIVAAALENPQGSNVYVRFGAAGRPVFYRIPQLAEKFAEFKKVTELSEIVAAVRDLLGPFETFRDIVVVKPPKDGIPVVYHQDAVYFDQAGQESFLSAWIPLADVPITSGCLTVIPGSHLNLAHHQIRIGSLVLPSWITRHLRRAASLTGTGENPGTPAQKFFMRIKNGLISFLSKYFPQLGDLSWLEAPLNERQVAAEVALPLKKGDALLFDGRLLHGSAPNLSSEYRAAYIVTFRSIGKLQK